jgi:hypothetical protein
MGLLDRLKEILRTKELAGRPELAGEEEARNKALEEAEARFEAENARLIELMSVELSPATRMNQEILCDDSRPLDERNAAYLEIRDEEIQRLRAVYDFDSIEGVESIPVPCPEPNGDSPTGRVEYYLRGMCFSEHWKAGRTELALACLRKAQDLMFVSDMIWQKRDFIRLPEYLYEAGLDDEAEAQLKKINAFFDAQYQRNERVQRAIHSAKIMDTDLMETFSNTPVCEECARYVDRLYSISGRDKRFPTFQKALDGCAHGLRCLNIGPFALGIMVPQFECDDIVAYSNRPFVDERTPDDIERYKDLEATRQKTVDDVEKKIHRIRMKRYDTETVEWLHENLPKLAPKSLAGFWRMQTMNTKNYQRLVEEAGKLGRDITKKPAP